MLVSIDHTLMETSMFFLWKSLTIIVFLIQVLNLLGWLLSIGICCACVYGPYSDGNKHVLSVEESAAFYGLMRTGWGVAVSWIIFSCATGYGGRFDENWLGCCC